MKPLVLLTAFVLLGCGKHASGPPRHRQLAVAALRSCRLTDDGAVTCWGEGYPGPTRIQGLTDATAITVGLSTSCALRKTGRLLCWGYDFVAMTAKPAPFPVEGVDHVVQVSAGQSHVCAVEESGDVKCWGRHFDAPTSLGLHDAVEVSCGDDHTCVRHRDGAVTCQGDLGPAPTDGTPIEGMVAITALASGEHHVCGLDRNGEVWCAGMNTLGELGAGDSDPHTGAVRVRDLAGIQQITASGNHGCARGGNGEVWCWGSEFGRGIMKVARTDDQDHGPIRIDGLDPVIDVAVGGRHACAALADGSVTCWGADQTRL